MNVARLQELIASALARRTDVEATAGGRPVRIEVGAIASPPGGEARPAGPTVGPETLPAGTIAAPCFGIVHLTPAPGVAPFVRVGDVVSAGQRLCLVEAMKVFNPVAAPVAGRVVEIHVASGEEVGRGQALLRLAAAPDAG